MPGPDRTPEITVVISTFGNYEVLGRVLDGYASQGIEPGRFELIVVADCADPDRARIEAGIERNAPSGTRLLTGSRPGLSANRNTGWKAASAPLVLITDNDTIPGPDLVAEHLAWHRRFPEEHEAILGLIRWAPELRLTPFMRWLDSGMQFDYARIDGIEAGWGRIYGGNSSFKRSFVERLGGWDEERLPYLYEDIDFGYRGSKQGLRVLYNERAYVDHVRHDATLEYWLRKVERLAFTEHAFVAKHPELDPWFFRIFDHAARRPPARGRGRMLARWVPKGFPGLGPYLWNSAELYWTQQLAVPFLQAWERAEAGQAEERPSALLEDQPGSGASSSGP